MNLSSLTKSEHADDNFVMARLEIKCSAHMQSDKMGDKREENFTSSQGILNLDRKAQFKSEKLKFKGGRNKILRLFIRVFRVPSKIRIPKLNQAVVD